MVRPSRNNPDGDEPPGIVQSSGRPEKLKFRTQDGLSPNPEQSANIFSRITFFFMTKFFMLGYKRTIEQEDMYQPLLHDDAQVATQRMTDAWELEKKLAKKASRDASLMRAIVRTHWKEIATFGILLLIDELIRVSQPLFMGRLIRYFRFDVPLTQHDALFAASGVAGTAAIAALIHHPYFYGLQKVGMQLKVAASGMIVNKGIRLSSAALQKATVGHMVNLLSTDVSKFDMSFTFIHYMWVSPILLVVYSYFLYDEIGVSAFAGYGALVLLIPIQGYFSTQMGSCRREIATKTDKRLSVMNEILNGIRVIKMYAWEGAFSEVIARLRRSEMKSVRAHAIFQSLVMGLFWSSGKLIVLSAAVCYYLTGKELTAERIFVATALYNSCRLPITLFLPFSFQFLSESRISVKRIQTFLELEEYSRDSVHKGVTRPPKNEKKGKDEEAKLLDETNLSLIEKPGNIDISVDLSPNNCNCFIDMQNYTSSWATAEEEGDDVFAVRNVSFAARRGQLIAIVGPVGAGKSSLLYSLLGEPRCVGGKLHMAGSVAYCTQDPWIFSGSIRENIIFGDEFDETRYKQALDVSALSSDVGQLTNGDATLVGDRGTSLSGGQKARVALARAVYADADILLLDDPLSAVDAAVGRFLFERCISGELKEKIVVLVTHQVQFLDTADIVILMKNGEVVASGSPSELKESHAEQFTALIQETERTYARQSSESVTMPQSAEEDSTDRCEITPLVVSVLSEDEKNMAPGGKTEHVVEVQEEDTVAGAVSWMIYLEYLKAMFDNKLILIPMLLFLIGGQILFNMTDFWLNKWTNAAELARKEKNKARREELSIFGYKYWISLDEYMYIFIAFTLLVSVTSVVRCVWFRLAQTVASVVLHKKMFKAIVNTKLSFFDNNPIGRILNRFSKDIGTMDEQLSYVFFEFLMGALNVFGLVMVITTLNPIVFLPTLPLVLLFLFVRVVYLSSSRDVKRLEATSRSPLYSHISAIMNGLVTVRAFTRQEAAMETYYHVQNVNSAAFCLSITTSRWFAVCIDYIVAVFVSLVAFSFLVFPVGNSSGEVALMLVYAVQLTGFFSWIMRQSAELQNCMVSVERIVEYTKLESEHVSSPVAQVSEEWPTSGHIKMCGVSLKYNGNSDYVLKNVNLDIKPMEKIGIVGRTGAGKSSLLRALFRLTVPCEGQVYIDDVNTAEISLKQLRKSIAIIPQEPVLFIGTLRRNMDPFNEYSDEAVWDALEQVELKIVVSELPGGLEASMQEGGINFSVGQRQLVCLARALLRHARVLVIDEATANVDPLTDSLIQKTIRSRFANSTVLTIAHRLNTIMDSTRVLVLRNGEVAELAPPHELLRNPDSLLTSLVEETGSANAALLRKIAEETYQPEARQS